MELDDYRDREPAATCDPARGDAVGQATRSGAPNGRGTLQRATRPKQTRRFPKSAARLKQENHPGTTNDGLEPAPRGAVGSLARTKRLILAAVRVWELKRAIRE